jgi:periplasmic divalent cation tolerance protein
VAQRCEVVITAPDPGWLKDFSRMLIEQRLCASAHNFTPVQSIYRWRGQIYERTEGRVSLHSRCDRVAEIIALVRQAHPYDVPGISTRAITDGNSDYLAWIADETAPAERPAEERPAGQRASEPPPE